MPPSEINETVNQFNDNARFIEAQLEELGRSICSVPSSGTSWSHINNALSELRRAIRLSHTMYQY